METKGNSFAVRDRDRERREKVHDGNAGGDLGPEVVDQVVEVGEGVELQQGMALIEHGQEATGRAHHGRRHNRKLHSDQRKIT